MSYGWPALSWSGDVRRQVGRDREQLIGLDWHRQMLIQRFKQLSQELLASSIQVSAEIKRDAAYSNSAGWPFNRCSKETRMRAYLEAAESIEHRAPAQLSLSWGKLAS